MQHYATEYEIPLKALYVDGRRYDAGMCADVGLIQEHRFTFRTYLSTPTILHRAIVLPVRDNHWRLIDLVAFIPSVNKATTFLGAKGVLGARRFAHRQANHGLRVYSDPMLFVRNGRYGILIVDPKKAAVELSGKLLLTQTVEEAQELAKLTLGSATIVVRPR